MTREELTEELLELSDTSNQLKFLNDGFHTFASKHEESELSIMKNCNTLLHHRIMQLEQNAGYNAQHHWREPLQFSTVPCDIGDNILEETVSRASSLTGYEVTPANLHLCQLTLKIRDNVTLKFHDRKLKCTIQINKNNIQQKSLVTLTFKISW